MSHDPSQREEAQPPIVDYRTPQADPASRAQDARRMQWAIICIAAALALIVLFLHINGRAGDRAHRVVCSSGMRAIGLAIVRYRTDHGVWPQTLGQVMIAAELDAQHFVCPSDNAERADGPATQAAAQLSDPKHCSYVYLPPPADAGNVDPETVILVERLGSHQGQGMNMVFADGHVEWVTQPLAQRLLADLQAGRNPPRWGTTPPATAPSSTQDTGGRP